ncbi:structure-specific recognition protein (macronuclear) [Tetrahymena thermophila SB210]|uniref:FACT complex subunit SSRP1 n=1 Tax=Tetrahymena thermophila (strain SB210) TaxID=312017 RepID=Q23D83_TETTS|nr:structure-specific recognition protein [Tetrahymena thermophila SB210]EAR94676.2 structure-specific recognition protein [Tetrahymena thermophila SB210]|eukprot:XP_001014803.2 structure-specific recognition protein [Tetrahymena thermophila SB210]
MSDRCYKGVNWGNVTFEDDQLVLSHNKRRLCKLSLKKFTNSTVNKTDIVIDLNTVDLQDDEDQLCEMRLFIPQQQDAQMKPEDDGEGEEKEGEDSVGGYADQLNSEIITKAKIGQYSGQSIVKFEDISLLVPRGKYQLDMYKKTVRFHGSSFNYIVEYSNVIKGFLLPQPDEVHVAFVLGLDQPLKIGNTVHSYIVMQFKKEQKANIKVNIDPEEKKEDKLKDLDEEYDGFLYEIAGQLFKTLCNNVQIIMPAGFQSSDKQNCLKCTLKTHQGLLYPMRKSLIFIYKPVIHIQISDIQKVEFNRVGNATLNKLFDVKVFTKTTTPQFFGFERKELDVLLEYFKSKNIKITYDDTNQGATFDDEDEEFTDSISEDEEEGKRAQRKSAKRANKAVKGQSGLPLDDDDEEEDEDFDADEFESEDDEEEEEDEDEDEDFEQ